MLLKCYLNYSETVSVAIIIIIIEKIEMGETCGTYAGRERCAQGFGGET